MYNEKKVYVLIVAAGSGRRMGKTIPKQFLELDGKMIIDRTIGAFEKNEYIDGIYLVINEKDEEFVQKELTFERPSIKGIAYGGRERVNSVFNGLEFIKEKNQLDDSIILIQDGVRPFVSQKMIRNCIELADKKDVAIPVLDIVDTLRCVNKNGTVKKTVDRTKYKATQTPQGFNGKKLFDLYCDLLDEGANVTDDACVFEYFGEKVYYYPGLQKNIKITTPFDLKVGELIARMI